MPKITNPILRGFNPDPSILRVGDDYYIATSTFEWHPGVQIHHSRDLVNWRLLTRPLRRPSQMDLLGVPNSGGIWAPCLSHDAGLFYLVYTVVLTKGSVAFRDLHNYLVTAPEVSGEWSDPVPLNSSGFDPSLFHDGDGRKWLVNQLCEYRKGRSRFAGIVLQEYAAKEKKLVGSIVNIFKGSEAGTTEGPHLYRHEGRYYLMTAEGGTGHGHQVTVARSGTITGPYEVDPRSPLLTSHDDPLNPLQKAGHGSLVQTKNGEWYLAHLCSRPIPSKGRSVLGRETALQKVEWSADGWLRLAGGGRHPALEVEAPSLPPCPWPVEPARDDFDSTELGPQFQTLRVPLGPERLSLSTRAGWLRLYGLESLSSRFNQSLVARRQQAFRYTATVCMEFEPESYQQLAGLVCFYDTQNFYYLRVSHDENLGRVLGIITSVNDVFDQPLKAEVPLDQGPRCYLRADVDYDRLVFSYSKDGRSWTRIGREMDASTLSDEHCKEGQFTGAFVGICCQDLSGRGKHADFDFFEYVER